MAERSDRWERWPVVWGRAHPVWGRAHPRWRRSRPGRAVRARPAWRLTVAVVVVASAPAVAVAGLGLALLAPPATAATPGYHDVVPARTQALRPTGLRLRATPEVAVHGSETTLTATLVRAGTSTGVPGQRVRFDVRPAGGTAWTRIGGARTSAAGVAVLRHAPARNSEYRARFVSTDGWASAKSGRRAVQVRTRISAALAPPTVPAGRSAQVTGTVWPNHAGDTVRLQRATTDGWREVDRQALSRASTYAFTVRHRSGGTFRYRVVKPADGDHERGVSPRRELTVRAYAFPVRPASAASYGRAHHDYPATDIFAACGTAVVSPTIGRVDEVSFRDTWDPAVNDGASRGGLSVSIVGDDGVRYYGSHLATIAADIRPGVRVVPGQALGTVGNTGSARPTPCHLHFGLSPPCGHGDWEVRRGVVFPWPYLDAWRSGVDRSPAREVAAWAAANPARCPAP